MAKEQNLYLLAIIAIVVIVGIVMLVLNSGLTSEDDLAGEAYSSVTKPTLESKLGGGCKCRQLDGTCPSPCPKT